MQNISKITEILNSINQLNSELEKETGFKVGQYVGWKGNSPVELKSIIVEREILFADVFIGTVNLRVPLSTLYKIDKEELEMYGLKQLK